jgi:hypothetical protein
MRKRNLNGYALVPVDPAYRRAINMHGRPCAQMPDYEKAREYILKCTRIDEVKNIADKAEAMRCYARQLHDVEAQNKWVLVRVRAYHRLGEIFRSLKRGHGPGRGKKKRCPGTGTSLFKIETYNSVGISRSRAHRAEQISRTIEMEEVEAYVAAHTARGVPVSIEIMINTLVRRQQIRPGIGIRPFTNNDEGLFGLEANGSKLSYEGRTYQATKRLSEIGRVKHLVRVAADLERSWHPLFKWVFADDQVANLVQHLSQLPIDQHEAELRRLAPEQEAPAAVDFVDVTKAANQRQPRRRTKKAARQSRTRHVETEAARPDNAR